MYIYANQHKIPILTHTTRTGAFYIGNNVREMVGTNPASFDQDPVFFSRILARINKYNTSNHRKLKLNDNYCNIFSHPENYLPILKNFKNLKLCFAHYGGTNEILKNTKDYMLDLELEKSCNWTELIRSYMLKYDNVFTDISYSLANDKTHEVFLEDMKNDKLSSRIFFGTDYFMEEQEKSEADVFASFRKSFLEHPDWYIKLVIRNATSFYMIETNTLKSLC